MPAETQAVNVFPESEYTTSSMRVRMRSEIAFASGADSIRRLKTLAHELAGSAGSLGFAEIGETAAALEQAADRVLDGSDEPAIVIMPMRQLIREVEFSR